MNQKARVIGRKRTKNSLGTRSLKYGFITLMVAVAMIISALPSSIAFAAHKGSSQKRAAVHVYAPTGDDPDTANNESPDLASTKYELTAENTSVPVIQYNSDITGARLGHYMDIARFASKKANTKITIHLKENTAMNHVTIYPERYYAQKSIKVDHEAKTITFKMSTKLRYAIIDVDGSLADKSGAPYLTIINDPKEQKPSWLGNKHAHSKRVLNFKTFAEDYLKNHPITDTVGQQSRPAGTAQDTSENTDKVYTWNYDAGKFVDYSSNNVTFPNKRARQSDDVSEAFQAALKKVKDSKRYDTIYFPAGTYNWSGLRIENWNGDRSKGGKPLKIYIDEGALLKNRLSESREAMEPGILISNSDHVTVSGRGIIDANGALNTRKDGKDADKSPHQGGAMVLHSKNIVFNDTYLRDAKQWNWEIHTVNHVTFNNVKGLSPYSNPWVDGFDLTSGKNVTVNGGITLGNDDTFASGHYNPSDEFPRRNFSEANVNRNAAAAIYNKDRLKWDTDDSENITLNNTLGWSLKANSIRLGHNTKWNDAAADGSGSYKLKSYTFNNFNSVLAGNVAGTNYGLDAIRVQNGNLNSYPGYEGGLVIRNSSFAGNSGANVNLVVGDSKYLENMGKVLIKDSWFSDPTKPFNLTDGVKYIKLKNIYLDGKKVTDISQANTQISDRIPNFSFVYTNQHGREIPVIGSSVKNSDDNTTTAAKNKE